MLIINQEEVTDLLPMDECMDVMAGALATLARGEAILPLRQIVPLPHDLGVFAAMPGYLASPDALGIKIITVFPKNHGTKFDSHQGVVLLFDTEHGTPVAMLDASSITAIRTAAVSGVATRALAREDSSELCLMGSGVQAQTHLRAMLRACSLERVRVWSRSVVNARRFAEWAKKSHDVEVDVFTDARDAVDGADILCTVTSAREPVLHGDWLRLGTHVNAVGASLKSARELDSLAVARASLFVDRRESTINEAGDFLIPCAEGVIADDHIRAELGDVLIGAHPGRTSDDEITVFKSLGLAVEDVASARYVYDKAVRLGRGMQVNLGGHRHA